jgi:hypothetical protein
MSLQKTNLRYLPLVLLFTGMIVWSCRETYSPETEPQTPVVVVDAFISNEPGPYEVKLNLSVAYNATQDYPVVTNASVYVTDQNDHQYIFREAYPGRYYSDKAEFRGVPGNTYTLHIETASGQTIVSKPQLMPVEATIDSVYGMIDTREYIFTTGGVYTAKKVTGVQAFADFSTTGDGAARFRFSTTLVVGYVMTDHSTQPYPSIIYAWKKVNPLKSFNLTTEGTISNQQKISRYDVCFFPVHEAFYQLADTETITNWFLLVKPYALTEDAGKFYTAVNEQLTTSNQIFDPIAAQVKGNLSCINQPLTNVFGFFEVSACSKKSFWVRALLGDNLAVFAPSVNIDSIPEKGRSVQEPPYFWRF